MQKFIPGKCDTRFLLDVEQKPFLFEECISSIKIGKTWKSTRKGRHTLTNNLICDLASFMKKPAILEIGASSGTTSIELINTLKENYKRYYVTDLLFEVQYFKKNKALYLYHEQNCIMYINDWFIFYEDIDNAVFPFGVIVKYIIRHSPVILQKNLNTINLIHPDLLKMTSVNKRITIKMYNIFTPWSGDEVNIIKAANVLNKGYFSKEQLISAIVNMWNALGRGGLLVVTDNREIEKISIFEKCDSGTFIEKEKINGGTEISDIISSCSINFESSTLVK
jgi:hypothetical protein